jgi:DNA polymerase-3 subunit alpha
MIRVIDSSSADTETALPSGQVVSAPSLVEGPDGLVYLLITTESVSANRWATAKFAEVVGVIKAGDNPKFATTAFFEEQAYVHPQRGVYELPDFMWDQTPPDWYFGPQEQAESLADGLPDELGDLFVNLHTHSEGSALDGYSKIDEMVAYAKELGQIAIALTDHGVCSLHPDLQDACDEHDIKPIFGMEAYLVEDRHSREDLYGYHHIVLWALDDEGLDNLWAMSTESWRDGLYGKFPRLDYDTLQRFNKGVAASTACLRGPVSHPYLKGNVALALQNLSRLKQIFEDRLYIEIHANNLEEQIRVNKWLVERAAEFDIPLLAAMDSHYTKAEERDDHQVWLAMQINRDVEDESSLFGGGQNYHIASFMEMVRSLSYLGDDAMIEAIANTRALAERCTARIKPKDGLPRYSVGPDAEQQDIDKLFELCMANWDDRVKGKTHSEEVYLARFEREIDLLIRKGFPGYFLMNADIVGYAKDNGVLVGPGRGSGAGSLVAYLCRITEVDPVENDLLFERFMTEGRTALPDFDIDYPSSRKQFMIDYAEQRFGKQHVVAVGTHTRIKNKAAFKDTAKAIKSRLPADIEGDLKTISKIIGNAEASTAGLGLPFDELMDVCEEEFKPFIEKMPYLFEMAEKFRGRLKTYSRHAAGLVIDPQINLENKLPMWLGANGQLTSQFDKDVLDKLGYVKFDFLNLRNLDTIQDTIDLIKERHSITIDVNRWRDEYTDQEVFRSLSEGWTLGCFQIETNLGTRTIKAIQPTSIADIADSITIGRPGPMRSGLDKTYFRRREGKEKVKYPDPRMEAVLSKTLGAMLYQEDIMALCMVLAGYDSNEADYVRKILGKKKPEEAKKEGIKFIERAIANNTDETVATALWAQMEEFSRYSFNRAHAFSYAVLSYWTAWLKAHYPLEFIVARLSDPDIDEEDVAMFISEARRMGHKVLPPDINESRAGFTATDSGVVRFGLGAIKGIGEAALKAIIPNQPYISFEDFVERSGVDKGVQKMLAHIGAFDSLFPNRKALEMQLAETDLKMATRCINYNETASNHGLPCNFDWDRDAKENPALGKTGKLLKNQPKPPKICSAACRKFELREVPSEDDVMPYTDAEIRAIEMEVLGTYLSSSPFDIIHPDDLEQLKTAHELQVAEYGNYLMAVLIISIRDHRQKDGKLMKFLRVATPSGDMDITAFASKVEEYGSHMRLGQMALVEVQKNGRGVNLRLMEPI